MPKFKGGDFLRRDGDDFTGIIKVAEYPLHDDDHEYIYFGRPYIRKGDICAYKKGSNKDRNWGDRLLTLKDISEIPLDKFDLNSLEDDAREFLKEAVMWCIING